jgi:penicillin-binding protein-related factor A (putative recombinase)
MGTPESNFWKIVRKNLPKNSFATRIESRIASGVPDCHIVWEGLSFWLELKTTKNNSIRITPNQIAWNIAYCSRGGFSFYLVKGTRQGFIYLFRGDQGSCLLDEGLRLCDFIYKGKSIDEMFMALRLCDFVKK